MFACIIISCLFSVRTLLLFVVVARDRRRRVRRGLRRLAVEEVLRSARVRYDYIDMCVYIYIYIYSLFVCLFVCLCLVYGVYVLCVKGIWRHGTVSKRRNSLQKSLYALSSSALTLCSSEVHAVGRGRAEAARVRGACIILWYHTVSFHNFKSQNLKSSVSNPKSKYVAYLPVLSQI